VERTAAAVQALLTPPSADPSTREEAGH
jgi:hypothetical protein